MSLSISDTIRCAKPRGLWALNWAGLMTAGLGEALQVRGEERFASGERKDTEHLVQSLIGSCCSRQVGAPAVSSGPTAHSTPLNCE
jgi:hypothetical protein